MFSTGACGKATVWSRPGVPWREQNGIKSTRLVSCKNFLPQMPGTAMFERGISSDLTATAEIRKL
jgi:hypothetical protein